MNLPRVGTRLKTGMLGWLLTLALMPLISGTSYGQQLRRVPSVVGQCAVFDCGTAALVPETVLVTDVAKTLGKDFTIGAVVGQPSTKKAGTVLIQTPAAGEIVPIGSAITLIVANDPKCGAILPKSSTDPSPATIGTQIAFSNGAMTGKWPNCADYQTPRLPQSLYGDEYQCPEIVNRFYAIDLKVAAAGTSTWKVGAARRYYELASALGLMRYPNYGDPESVLLGSTLDPNAGAVAPKDNDILVFEKEGSKYGHVALIKHVGTSTITVVEQNNSSTAGERTLDLVSHPGGLWEVKKDPLSKYVPIGWLRKPPASPPLPFSDSFELYTPGTFPSTGGWFIRSGAGGTGAASQLVTNARANAGAQSLRLESAAGLGVNVQKLLTPFSIPTTHKYALEAFVNTTSSTYKNAYIGFGTANDLTSGMRLMAGGSLASADLTPIAGNYSANTWIDLRLLIDPTTNLYDVFLNGTRVGQNLSTITDAGATDRVWIAIDNSGIGGLTGTVAYIDDVSVVDCPTGSMASACSTSAPTSNVITFVETGTATQRDYSTSIMSTFFSTPPEVGDTFALRYTFDLSTLDTDAFPTIPPDMSMFPSTEYAGTTARIGFCTDALAKLCGGALINVH